MAVETFDNKHILSLKLIKSAKAAKVGIKIKATKTRGCNYVYIIPIKYYVTFKSPPTSLS